MNRESNLQSNRNVDVKKLAAFLLIGLGLSFLALRLERDRAAAVGPKLRVVVFGGHPDDPESASGGLIAQLTKAGHEVILAYGTCFRGDRKFGGEPEGIVRRREATAACKVLARAGVL